LTFRRFCCFLLVFQQPYGKAARLKILNLIFLALTLAACAPTVANRGNILDADTLRDIKPGVSTREEVATKLGTPTQVSTFDDKIWYYIGRRTEQYSFLDPEVVKQKAVEVRFDDKGVVLAVNDLDLAGAEDIVPVDRATPTYGRDDTFIKQLLGNLSHPTPMQTKQEGQ
jgi:outer membrane protein assembly factor BamE (lipoprotein component of BamABCDE complex)